MTDNLDVDASPEEDSPTSASPARSSARPYLKVALFAAVVLLVAVLFVNFRDRLSLSALAARETELVSYGRAHPALILTGAFAIYVAVTSLSLPGALALTVGNAWLMRQLFGPAIGFVAAALLVSFASTLGATLAFLLSRYLFRDAIHSRFGQYLVRFNAAWKREGAFYLFTLRLIPQVPFFVINAVMGLTPIRTRTFWWVSQLGMLPGTALYVYAGWAVPSLRELATRLESQGIGAILTMPLIVAFVLLGLFPLAVKKLMSTVQRARSRPDGE